MGKKVQGWKPPEDAVMNVTEGGGDGWTPPQDAIASKKKDNTLSEVESQKQSSQPGLEESGAESKQPTKPSVSPTATETEQGGSGLTEKILGGVFDFIGATAKTGYSTLKHTLPQAIDYLHDLNPPESYEEKI